MLRCSGIAAFVVLHNASKFPPTAAAWHLRKRALSSGPAAGAAASTASNLKPARPKFLGERVGPHEAAAQMPKLVQAMARRQELPTEKLPAGDPVRQLSRVNSDRHATTACWQGIIVVLQALAHGRTITLNCCNVPSHDIERT